MNKSVFAVLWAGTLVVVGVLGWRMTAADVSFAEPSVAASTASAASPAVARAYVPGPIQPLPLAMDVDARKVSLGEQLFHDGRLSSDGRISCSSCHDLSLGGADGRRVSVGVGGAKGKVNAPTVLNCTFNFRQFWDGRARSLAEQVDGPIHNPLEMDSDWESILRSLGADTSYARSFDAIYDDGITPANVRDAIVEFERSLITPNSRFDRFLLGESGVLNELEQKGWDLFVDVGCVTCHQGVNIGGNMFQTLGRVVPYFEGREVRPQDLGRFNVTGRDEDRHAFKVPSLRNVALTAPYMHDGGVSSLAEMVQTMARFELGAELEADEVTAIVAFLHTLTGDQPGGGR